MKVLITGNEGFIGSRIANSYKQSGAELYGWDMQGFCKLGELCQKKSLLDGNAVLEVLSDLKPDMIIHCAGNANVNTSVADPMMDLQGNGITTHNLLFSMKKLEMTNCRFILLSSAAVYGNPEDLPISESSRINPLSPYALHKHFAENICFFMARNYGMDVKVLRIFSAYGPGLRKQLFWDMHQKLQRTGKLEMFGSGYESRDYIYIDDLIAAIRIVAERAPREEIVYNIANGTETTILEAVTCFAKNKGVSEDKIQFTGNRREGEPINWRADVTKLKALGYKQMVSFDDGIRRYVQWVDKEA